MRAFLTMILSVFMFEGIFNIAHSQTNNHGWNVIDASGSFTVREENTCILVGDEIFFIGGRGQLPVDVFNITDNSWSNRNVTPVQMNHFQAVKFNKEIYAICAQYGPYPHEKPFSNIYVYNPKKDSWRVGDSIPQQRRRGSCGCVVYKDKMYVVGGIIDGHWDGHVKWFDEYNPVTGEWKQLPDAPRARDHFEAVVFKDKLYCIGGRRSYGATKQVFNLTVDSIDVYDFKSSKWSTLKTKLPTPRAGASVVVVGNEMICIGGESVQPLAHNECEAYNPYTNKWRNLPLLSIRRHGTTAVAKGSIIFIGAGASRKGGTPKEKSIEKITVYK